MGFAKTGTENFVNTTTVGEQYGSAVTQLANGDIVVAWTDDNNSAVNVFGQILSSDGQTKDGAEFRLNRALTGDQFDVSVTALGNGGFAAGWTSGADFPAGADEPFEMSGDGEQTHVVTQIFSSAGTKVGGEDTHFLDSDDYPADFNPTDVYSGLVRLDYHLQSTPTLTANLAQNNDDFDLLFVESLSLIKHYLAPVAFPTFVNYEMAAVNIADFSGAQPSFLAPSVENATWDYEASISPLTPLYPANFETPDTFTGPKSITLDDGTVATAYERYIRNSSSHFEALVDIAGVPNPIRVGSDTARAPDIAELENGDLIAVWIDSFGSYLTSNDDIRGQLLAPDGTKIGGEFSISSVAGQQSDPQVSALADGRFVVVWVDSSGTGGDASGSSIKGQIFTSDGVKSGNEFLINTVIDDSQHSPTVTALDDGKFIVTWTSADGATEDIKSQVFDPRDYTGDGADDTVYGGDDDDTLDGGGGTDTLYGGGGNDVFENVTSDDFTDGDVFDGGEGIDTVEFDDPIQNWGGPPVLLGGDSAITGVEIFNLDDGLVNDIELAIPLANSSSTGNVTVNGGTGVDLVDGGRIANTDVSLFLNGNGGNDTLQGGSGDDTLSGGEGGDAMEGGGGDDIYVVDSISDTVTEGLTLFDSNDFVISFIDYTLDFYLEHLALSGSADLDGTGNVHDNEMIGNSGWNTLTGLEGDDTLYGEEGNDRLDGGTGADTMKGGEGDDTYIVDHYWDWVDELEGEGGADEIVTSISIGLAAHVEKLDMAGSANLFGVGNLLDNIMTGNGGNNFLTGVLGADSLYGFGGNDVLWGGQGGDILSGHEGSDTAIYTNSAAAVNIDIGANLASGGDATGDALTSIENIAGSSFGDILTGNTSGNVLNGGAGADTMTGGLGHDTFIVDNVADGVIEALNGGYDTVQTTLTSYTLGPDVERLYLFSTLGTIGYGNGLANIITGNSGTDVLLGLGGIDTLAGAGGNDSLRGGESSDTLNGGEGIDTASYTNALVNVNVALDGGFASTGEALGDSFVSVENLQGSNLAAGDSLRGDNLANALIGLAGNDTLRGLDGADQIAGGEGTDTLQGDLGNDRFNYFAATERGDILVDFSNVANNDDAFQFLGSAFGGLPAGTLSAANFVSRAADNLAQDANDVFIFNQAARQLWYDATGSGGGAADAILIANLQVGATLSNVDILIF